MNPVVHFEMPYRQSERVVKFYEQAFGWKMQAFGPEMGDYVLAATTDSNESGRPTQPGAINGGFFPTRPEGPPPIPSVVIAVDDIADGMKQVEAAGGEVLGEPVDIPGVGKYVSFTDTEGNRVSLLQPLR